MSEVAAVKTVRLYAFRDYSSGRWQGSVAVLRDGTVVRVPRRGEDWRIPHVVEYKVVREYAHGDLEEKIVEFTVDTDVLAVVSGFGRPGWCTMGVVEGEGQAYVKYYPQAHVLYTHYDPEIGRIRVKIVDCSTMGP